MIAPAHRWWQSREGLRLHAYDYAAADGDARLPVICLHGLTRNGRDFGELAPWVAARGRRTLAIDVRGRGLSDRDPAATYQIPFYVDDVATLLDGLGIAKAVFVGTSMGGLITMATAAIRPDLIASAVINDVGPELAVEGLTRIASYVGQASPITSWADAADHLRRQNEHALPHYARADWDAMARRMFREQDGAITADYDPAIAKGFAGGAPDVDPWTFWNLLAKDRPVLLLRGALSDLLAEDVAARMTATAPTIRFAAIPDVGHAPMLDEPAALAAIGAFLQDMP
ncbi:alpha/beta fold hydrolase [Sphingomonas crocodyli]|uniref:Alpha/beta fold hydrolase n=1 Tax=Sphingomonas crocodyli TaxID=1979270 RepID=A0A437LUT5_9SPHN|nr:alpha/beta fold hydrolase [Sphingomonas crocodyli]RVT89063.1 alpha/beta fold hydrolase [Sphingomonas crocodyli]